MLRACSMETHHGPRAIHQDFYLRPLADRYSSHRRSSNLMGWVMKFVNVRRVSAVSAFALVLTGVACSAAPQSHGPLEKTHIVIDDFPSVDSAGLYIAEQQGL